MCSTTCGQAARCARKSSAAVPPRSMGYAGNMASDGRDVRKQHVTGFRIVQVLHVVGPSMSRHSVDDHPAHSTCRPHSIVSAGDEQQGTVCALSGNGRSLSGVSIVEGCLEERQHGEPSFRVSRSHVRWKREVRKWLPPITPSGARLPGWLREIKTNPYDAARCICDHGSDQTWKRCCQQQRELATPRGTDDSGTTVLGDDVVPAEEPTETSLDALQRNLHHGRLRVARTPVRQGQTGEAFRHAKVQEVLWCPSIRAAECENTREWATPFRGAEGAHEVTLTKSDLHRFVLVPPAPASGASVSGSEA